MTPDERFAWDYISCAELFSILYQQPDIQDGQLKQLLLYIEHYLWEHDFEELDVLLEVFDPSKASKVASIALVRFTYKARAELPHWEECVDRIKTHFEYIGEDANKLLRGLLNA